MRCLRQHARDCVRFRLAQRPVVCWALKLEKRNAADHGATRIDGVTNFNSSKGASSVPTAAAVPTTATEQQDDKNNDQDRFHKILHLCCPTQLCCPRQRRWPCWSCMDAI